MARKRKVARVQQKKTKEPSPDKSEGDDEEYIVSSRRQRALKVTSAHRSRM